MDSHLLLPRCALFLEEAFHQTAGETRCAFTWWRFADRLAAHARSLTLSVPLGRDPCSPEASPIWPAHLRVEGRFLYRRTEEYYLRGWRHRADLLRTARELLSRCNLAIIRAPSPPALLFARLAWGMGKPTVLFVAGDVRQASAYANARGPKAAAARWMAGHLRRQELRIARGSALVAVWGRELLPIFSPANPRTAVAAAPNMSRQDIYRRTDTMAGQTVRIVRVARILPSKGLEHLLEAVALLRRNGRDVRLDIAGGPDDPAYLRQLEELSRKWGIGEHVRFHGVVEFGESLFKLYREADIHVISSLSEGLPRCVVEGRAMGLPTIATQVGGLPTVVRHEVDGLLVEPHNAKQIAEAVERLIADGPLRRRIIEAGYAAAETQTAEFQAHRLASLMAGALRGEDISGWALDLERSGPAGGAG